MKHRLKGLLALVLSLMMVLGLMTCAWGVEYYDIWVGGTRVNNANAANVLVGDPANDGKVIYNAANNTLTLDGANISVTNDISAIYASGNLTISLIGNNKVETAYNSGAYGVSCDGTLTIEGSGSLTAVGESQGGGYGISAYSIAITEGTVIAKGSTNAVDVYTVLSFGNTHKATASENFDGSNPESAYDEDDINLYKYLKIEPITYTVTYASGGGTGTDPTQSPTAAGGMFTLAQNPYTRNGYKFTGWNDGTTTYAAGDTYIMPASNVTLTAQWEENSTGAPGNTNPYPPYIYNPTPTPEPEGDKVTSSDTFDGGIASAVVVTILSATGGAWLAKKKD